jgi:hypothetical protein
MFLIRLTVASIGVALFAAMVTPVSVSADPGLGWVECDQNPHPGCELIAGQDSQAPSGEQSGSNPESAPDGGSNIANCGGPGEPLCSLEGFIQNPAPTVADVAQFARSRLRLPRPAIAASPAADQLVHLPTWLWLTNEWRAVSATAAVPGVSVTAVARPNSVTWSMGDGGMVICLGPGTPWQPGMNPRAPSPDCGHTYRTSSAGHHADAFPVTATVDWTVTWSGAGQSGTFPNMTTSMSAAFRVVESHAIGTG